MDKIENTPDISIEDILREFSENPEDVAEISEETSIEETLEAVKAATEAAEAALNEAQAAAEAEDAAEALSEEEPSDVPEEAQTEENPEETPEEPEETPEEVHAPIPFRPRNRLQELKHQIVQGPEKRYYELSEIGLGRVQLATLGCFLLVLLCAGATALYAMDMIPENRLRLMVFSQVLAMLVSALLGCYVLMDGIGDLLKFRFTMNAMLFITFVVCCTDAVFCLQELRVPCCAAFCLEMTLALNNRYLKRYTEIGQMDTLRKAVRLDSIARVEDYYDGYPGFVRGEGNVADFMDNYSVTSGPEKTQRVYVLIALLASCGIAGATWALHGVSLAIRIFATSLLVSVPVTLFIAASKPAATLQRRLHLVGTVICGWQGVKGLCEKAAFPLRDVDLFPGNATKLNGVKFYGDRNPDEVVSYAASLMCAEENGLHNVFTQLSRSRNGVQYDVENFINYPNGGIGGEVDGEPVLMGSLNFLQDMGVEIPDGTMVSQAVYCSIDGQLSAVFAISYAKMKSAAAGLVTLCGCRAMTPVLVCGDFMVDESFIRSKFGINTRRIAFPDRDIRRELRQRKPAEETIALALTIQDGLAASAYAVTGARALRMACKLGLIVHIAAGIIGLLIMAALAVLGSAELLTPFNVLLYQIVWMVPGLLISGWTRTV